MTSNDWPEIRLRFLAKINPPVPVGFLDPDATVTFLPLECVWPGDSLDTTRTRPFHEVATGFTRFSEGDVLIPKITPTFQAGRSAVARGMHLGRPGFGTTELHVVRAGPDLDARFLYYRTLAHDFLSQGTGAMIGVAGQQRVPTDFLRDFPIHLPPLEEQRARVAFLDAECAHIDKLQAVKVELLGLLREKLASSTQELAFRGLDPSVPMKASGLPTIGHVPCHWSVQQNKTLVREVVDLSTMGTEELLTVSHLTGVTPRTEKDVNMFMAESLVGYKRCKSGDLVINTMWAWMGALGISQLDGIVSPAYGVYRLDPVRLVPAYYDLLYRTAGYVAEMTRYSKGIWSSRLRLYPDSFLSLKTLVPPTGEQSAIAHRARALHEPIDSLRAAVQASQGLIREHRRALITAVVTGQLDPPCYRRPREIAA